MTKKPIVGIIGGNGKMGSWFRKYFIHHGFKVAFSDIGTELTNEKVVKGSDAIIFSVPISKTVEVIDSVMQFTRKDQILLDLTSIKSPAVGAMMRSDCEVLGMHPMFGPFVDSIDGQTIVLCKERERGSTGIFISLFEKTGAKIKYATPEEHDRMMAVVQGMTHFLSIVSANAMMSQCIDIDESIRYSSPVYKIQMQMIGRIMAQDPKLYAEIEICNPYNAPFLKQVIKSSVELQKIVESKDIEGFTDYFKRSAEHMGEFKDYALKESNKLIGGKNG